MEKKILLINYYWPPCGGSAVQRWLDITKFLARQGIQTLVVTIDESVATYPFVDETLKDRIDPSTKVFTTNTSELFSVYKRFLGKVPSTGLVDQPNPGFLQKVARFARGNFFLPDPRIGWNKHAYKEAHRLIKEEGIKTIFTAGPPHSSHLIGLKLKENIPGLQWIADFHDYWTDIAYLSLFYRTKIAAYFDKKIEKKVLNNSDAVMTHCQSAKKILQARITEGSMDKVFVHTMGFNEELFEPVKPTTQENFIVSYIGMLAATYQPEAFLKAVKGAIDAKPDVKLTVRIVGNFTENIKDIIEAMGLTGHVEMPGYLPHNESIKYLYKTSGLFLLNPKFESEKIIVPGKLYEYLAVFKPIIHVGPKDGETAQIIDDYKAGKSFERDDIAGIKNYLVDLMNAWEINHQIDLPFNQDVMKNFGRNNEAIILAAKIK